MQRKGITSVITLKCCVSVCVPRRPGFSRWRLPVPLRRGLLRPRGPGQLDGAAGEQRDAAGAALVRPLPGRVSAVQGRPLRGAAAAHPQGRPARHAGRLHGAHPRRRRRALQEQEEKGQYFHTSIYVKLAHLNLLRVIDSRV
jgi:hypothetical protein